MRIALGIRGHSKILGILKEHLPEDEFVEFDANDVAERTRDCAVIIPIVTPVSEQILQDPSLSLVQQYGVGLDIVDVVVATRSGVLVANVPSVGSGNAESVAELAIAHMLMLCRQIPTSFERFRERRFSSPLGECLWQSTVVILGYGGIGQEIARRLAGFGVRIIAVSRHGPSGSRERDLTVVAGSLLCEYCKNVFSLFKQSSCNAFIIMVYFCIIAGNAGRMYAKPIEMRL